MTLQYVEIDLNMALYKCLHGLAPEYLSDLISLYKPTRNLRSFSAMQLVVPKTKLTSYGDRAFSKSAPVLWNSLPVDVKSATTIDSFKQLLKTHLFKDYFKLHEH